MSAMTEVLTGHFFHGMSFNEATGAWEAECTCDATFSAFVYSAAEASFTAHQTDMLTAAGYSKPRTITTVAELDALPVGAVVHWKGTTATRSFQSEPAGLNWVAIGSAMGYSVHEFNLPVTVLYEPSAK